MHYKKWTNFFNTDILCSNFFKLTLHISFCLPPAPNCAPNLCLYISKPVPSENCTIIVRNTQTKATSHALRSVSFDNHIAQSTIYMYMMPCSLPFPIIQIKCHIWVVYYVFYIEVCCAYPFIATRIPFLSIICALWFVQFDYIRKFPFFILFYSIYLDMQPFFSCYAVVVVVLVSGHIFDYKLLLSNDYSMIINSRLDCNLLLVMIIISIWRSTNQVAQWIG